MIRCACLAGLLLAAPAAAAPHYGPSLDARMLDRTEKTVARHYWDRAAIDTRWPGIVARHRRAILAAPDRRTLYAELGAMLDELSDSHLFVVDPVRLAIERDRDKGRDAGFGFTAAPDADGRWAVTAVTPGSGAASAGMQPGWAWFAIDGRAPDIDDRAAAGSTANLRLRDPAGIEHRLRLTAAIELPVLTRSAHTLPGGVLLVRLDGFDPGDERWMRQAIAADRPRALILDLRHNDGGDAEVVARVAGLLFPANRLLLRQIGRHPRDQLTEGAGPGSFIGPLAVLVGPESASGAEAIAALIVESRRGRTVGARTAGALTGAALYPLPDGGQLSVAEFDIRTPAGHRIEGVGVVPDASVSSGPYSAGADPVLDAAVRLVARR